MTAVVGILNKQGVAIAADSAVTRGRNKDGRKQEKVTKNGNKMVRLCEAVPVAVMITGNADFLQTPWDVIARRYRQIRGSTEHHSVEAAVHDFFSFIQSDPVFWDGGCDKGYLRHLIEWVFNRIVDKVGKAGERTPDGNLRRPASFVKSFRKVAKSLCNDWERSGICTQFKEYPIEQFRVTAHRIIGSFLSMKNCQLFDEIHTSLEEAVWTRLRTRFEEGPSATLVFSGYGKGQKYPSLVSALVCEGFDRHVSYHIRPEDIVCISEERPVSICPYAQDDVIRSILRGIHIDWSKEAGEVFQNIVNPFSSDIFGIPFADDSPGVEFYDMLSEVRTSDLQRMFYKEGMRMLDKNQHEWEKLLEDSDLETLASLADCLIDLTGFHRILTFSQEGVGGPVDVAVISKNDGFTWLRRKNWYHKDGYFGV